MSSKPFLLLLAAGGTGGHMFPAQSLAEAMLAKGWRVKLSTDSRGARYTNGFPDAVEIEQVTSATFARGGLMNKLAVLPLILLGLISGFFSMRRDRPTLVVGFGGYPSIPVLGAAWLQGLPSVIHEQNGVLGQVNQLFAKRVARLACGTWPTVLPNGVSGEHIGNPVRAKVLQRAGAGYIPPGSYSLSVLVMGGSQGARILSDLVPPALAELPICQLRRLRVSHQARAEDILRVQAFYAERGIDADVDIFFDDIPRRISEAQLVISRAGASSVADISVIGRPSILIPLASALRDEQTANAKALVAAEAAILLPEVNLSVAELSARIAEFMDAPEKAIAMAKAALNCAVPDATERLVALVEELAQGDHL